MKSLLALPVALLALAAAGWTAAPQDTTRSSGVVVSFRSDVFPIVQKHCLPCHSEESYNKSELSLDSYALLMQGGKDGVPVVPGKSSESLLVKKLLPDPPLGDRMPLARRRDPKAESRFLSDDEVRTIAAWIDQGAKDN